MKAIVHLGLPKTGTSSIQAFLKANASTLSRRGICYAQIPNDAVPAQDSQLEFGICQFAQAGEPVPDAPTVRAYGLANPAAHRLFAAKFEQSLRNHVARCTEHTFIISSEHIGAWTTTNAQARALDNWLKTIFDDVRYVLYVRRQEDWVISCYMQALRDGRPVDLDSYLKRYGAADFNAKADPWLEAVGHDRFDVRILEEDAMVEGDLICDFADAIGFDPEGMTRTKRRNAGFSPEAAIFLQSVNRLVRDLPPHQASQLRSEVEMLITKNATDTRVLALGPNQVADIRRRNDANNERLRTTYFPERADMFPAKAQMTDGSAYYWCPDRHDLADLGAELVLQILGNRLEGLGKLSEAVNGGLAERLKLQEWFR